METKIKDLLARLAFFAADGMAEPPIVAIAKDADALLKEMCRAQPEPESQQLTAAYIRAMAAGLYDGMGGHADACSELMERLAKDIAAAEQAQQAEPVALSLPFFAYDEEVGFERLATEAEAKKFVQGGIDECRSNMLQGEAWPSEIENLCWGVVLGTIKEIKLCETEDGSGDYYSDYVLTDTAKPPAVAVAVPDGYALVPVEPTAQMVESGFGRDDDNCKFWLHPAQAYRAMLAAAQKGGA